MLIGRRPSSKVWLHCEYVSNWPSCLLMETSYTWRGDPPSSGASHSHVKEQSFTCVQLWFVILAGTSGTLTILRLDQSLSPQLLLARTLNLYVSPANNLLTVKRVFVLSTNNSNSDLSGSCHKSSNVAFSWSSHVRVMLCWLTSESSSGRVGGAITSQSP
jgi:hypothetical protein